MAEFIKVRDEIEPKPKLEGMSYDLVNGKVYDLFWDGFNDRPYLKENGELNMPKKIYKLKNDDDFINRVLTYFNSDISGNTTGVLLSGTKGTGKTMLSKRIAIESGLPIIVVSIKYPMRYLTQFFKEFTTPVVVMFDEIEKNSPNWNTKDLLSFLDGIEATSKKLVLMTCNQTNELDSNLFDRCSRIRYFKEYEADSNSVFVRYIAEDKGVKNIDEVVDFIVNKMEVKSFDNICSLIDEIILFEDKPLEELAKVMNITISEDDTDADDDDV